MPQWLFKYSIYSKSWGIVLHNQCTQETWHCIKLSIWNWFNFYSKFRIRPSRVLWIILRTFDNVNVNNFRNEEMTSWLRVQDLMIFIVQLAVLPCSDRPGIGIMQSGHSDRDNKNYDEEVVLVHRTYHCQYTAAAWVEMTLMRVRTHQGLWSHHFLTPGL